MPEELEGLDSEPMGEAAAEAGESGLPFTMGDLTGAPDQDVLAPPGTYELTLKSVKAGVATNGRSQVSLMFTCLGFPAGVGGFFHRIKGDLPDKPMPGFVKAIDKALMLALGMPLDLSKFKTNEEVEVALKPRIGKTVKVQIKHSESGGRTYANVARVVR